MSEWIFRNEAAGHHIMNRADAVQVPEAVGMPTLAGIGEPAPTVAGLELKVAEDCFEPLLPASLVTLVFVHRAIISRRAGAEKMPMGQCPDEKKRELIGDESQGPILPAGPWRLITDILLTKPANGRVAYSYARQNASGRGLLPPSL